MWIFVLMVIVLFTVDGHVFALPENQMENLGVSCTNHSGRKYNDLTVRLVDPDGLQVTPSQVDLGGPIPAYTGWGAATFHISAPPNSASPDPDHVLTFECVWNQRISIPVKVHVIVEPAAQAPWAGGSGLTNGSGFPVYAVAEGTKTGLPVYCENTGSVTFDNVVIRVIDDAGLMIGPSPVDLGELAPGQQHTANFNAVAPDDLPLGHHVVTFACEGQTPDGHGISSPVKVDVDVHPAGSFCQGGFCFSCFIATATYGSESAPEVQFLRNFRDLYVLNTFSGRSFMVMFNSFYYSFSPQVASVIASNTFLREFMQIFLRPMLAILWLAYYVSFGVYQVDAEAGVMLTGLIACSLLGLVYLSPVPALLAWRGRRYRQILASRRFLRMLVLIFFSSAGLVILASLVRLPSLALIATSVTAVTIIIYAAFLPTFLGLKIWRTTE